MRCQVKILCFLALLIITFSLDMIRADELGWKALTSDTMDIEAYSSAQGEVISSYIPFFKDIGQKFWGWDPKKELKKTSGSSSPELQFSSANEMMKSLFVEFDVSNIEHFRKLWFKPTDKTKFRGLFGIHDFTKKRPLVILRLGIHGNVDELIAERFLAKIIYEDLDANFLIIESLTSHAFVSKNKDISLGGVDEGLQTFLALNEVTRSKLNPLIKSVHLLSLSMGSHGTFITAMLDQFNGHKIKSIVNFCPLINIKETFEYHNKPESNLQNALVDLWNVRRLVAVFDIYGQRANLHDWWKTIFDLRPRFTPAMLDILNQERKQPLISTTQINQLVANMKWPIGLENHFNNSQSLFELNNFWPHYQGVKTPMMIYTTPKDPLVVNELNSELIFSGKQAGDFSNLKYLRLEHGIHCGLAPVYQWDYIVKLVKDGLGI